MSRLDELIRELCPDGVEYKTLGEIIVSLNTGLNPRKFFKLNTEDASNYYVTIREIQNGTIVFSDKTDRINDTALQLCNNRSNLEVGDVLFSGTGTIGETAVISSPPTNWNIKEGVYVIKPRKDVINERFLMYMLRTRAIKKSITKKVAGGTVKSIPMVELKNIQLPVPPLPVQQEIVRILDTFTALTAELTAELTARKKQYEYYRDRLLSFDVHEGGTSEVQWKTLGHVVTIERGTRLVRNQLNDNEKYPVFQNALTPLGYYREYNREPNNTFMICAGAAGQIGFSDIHFWAADDCYTFKCCDNLNNKFLFHVLKNNQHNIDNKVRKASIPRISREAVGGIKIPIPPLEIQNRIVSILDRFDSLCNDLSSGLPAEIEARRKQYEYYRDRLLTFKEKKG